MRHTFVFFFLMLLSELSLPGARAAELHPPKQVTAGSGFSIATTGSRDATFYLVGPTHRTKQKVRLGNAIEVAPEDVRDAGRYIATVCGSDGCVSSEVYVVAAAPAELSFLVHPSRVPVSAKDAISAVAFVFDRFHNLVLQPVKVNFNVAVKDAPAISRSLPTNNGVAWMHLDATRKGGPAQVVASLGNISEHRVVQQVASDACNLRIKAARKGNSVTVETETVRDCSGNPVPDGTVVTFTATDAAGKTTVDAPIKRGIARAQMPLTGGATISVASGVAMGNEVRVGGTP